jgi:hypothetical protein
MNVTKMAAHIYLGAFETVGFVVLVIFTAVFSAMGHMSILAYVSFITYFVGNAAHHVSIAMSKQGLSVTSENQSPRLVKYPSFRDIQCAFTGP